MLGPWYGVDLGILYRWLFYDDGFDDGDIDIQLGMLLLF
jgi:hypothetical protein